MRVSVTGASGFLGGRVVPLLIECGYQVAALARSSEAADRVRSLGAEPVSGDLDDALSLRSFFRSSSTLLSLASLGFSHTPAIIGAARAGTIERAIFVSTTAIFTTLNSTSRRIRQDAEQAIRESNLAWTIVRPTMIYGTPADRNMARLLRYLVRFPVVPLPGGGSRLQQPVHVDDLAEGIVTALERPNTVGMMYELAGPAPLTFRRVVEEAASAVGRKPLLLSVPLSAAVLAVRVQERVLSHPLLRVEQIERLAEDKSFDITAAARDLAYEPRPFSEGIAQEARMLRLAG